MSERGKRADYTDELNKDLLLMLDSQPLSGQPGQKRREDILSDLSILSEKNDFPEEADLPELDELPEDDSLSELDELPEDDSLSELDELPEDDSLSELNELPEDDGSSEIKKIAEEENSFELENFPEFRYLTQTPAAAVKKRKKNGKSNERTKHASPWKEAAATPNAAPRKEKKAAGNDARSLKKRQPERTKMKKHKDAGDRRFMIMTICIVIGVLAASGALIYVSLLFLY